MGGRASVKEAFPSPPAHVPGERIFDFDLFYDPTIGRDAHEGHLRLLDVAPDIFWTPRNGGHWIATSYAAVTAVLKKPSLFSSVNAPVERTQPLLDLPVPPVDLDAPEHRPHRMLLLHFLSASATRAFEPEIRQLVSELIDDLKDERACEFRSRIAVPLPARMFATLMHLDPLRFREYASWVDAITAGGDRSRIAPAQRALNEFVAALIDARIAEPGDDPVSHLLGSSVDGQPLSRKRVHDMCCFLFLAGLDTLTKALTFIMNWLARHPEAQQSLRTDPGRIPQAVEELLRRLTFLNLARRVTEDCALEGVALRAEDIVICSLAAASNDNRFTPCASEVDFDRGITPHLAFGMGVHACPGAPLARTELRIFLEEWLRRMPDVGIAPGFEPRCRGGMVMGMEALHLAW